MKKSVMSLALALSFVAPHLASASAEVARPEVSVQKIDQINGEIAAVRTKLRGAKIKKVAAISISVTTGLVSALAVWGRVANLTEDGFRFHLRRDEFSTGLEVTAAAAGAISAGYGYVAHLKGQEIAAFDAKLQALQELLLATRAGLEAAEQ